MGLFSTALLLQAKYTQYGALPGCFLNYFQARRGEFLRVWLKGIHLYLQVNISSLSEEKNAHPELLIQKQLVFQQVPIFNLNSAPAILNVTKKCNPEIMPGAKSIKGTSE